MMRSLVVLSIVIGSAGCSTDPPASPDAAPICTAYDAGVAEVSAKTVTRAQVDAIFQTSCSFSSSCHGTSPGSSRLYLPTRDKGDWYPNVVNVASTTHKTMKRVVPGDPQNSFLVQKLTDGLCAIDKDCNSGVCGDRMPQASDPLPKEDFDVIVAWVREGATDK
jgi:hypothetical protein